MTQSLIGFPSDFDLSTIYITNNFPQSYSVMKNGRGLYMRLKICRLLHNMAVRSDESISRPANKRRSWKAPDKGRNSDEAPKDMLSLKQQPRDDSILHIDGSVLEGVSHVTLRLMNIEFPLGWSDTAECSRPQLCTVQTHSYYKDTSRKR